MTLLGAVAGSDGGGGAAVDDVFGPDDGRGAVGDKEGDELGDFLGPVGTAERDAAQGIHEPPQRRFLRDVRVVGDPGDEVVGGRGLHETGRDGVDTDAVRGDLVGQALAVGGQGGLGGGVGQGSV